ncbi:MAG: glycine oxidase ThiO [Alphaproteobacteria bacterium]|nr:glycine oxidase ThiO [Alphaproteobacteria bacterium]
MKVLIIGAGVAGLGIGWRLLQAGCSVTILERAQPGGGASWAAAGMLAVTAELEDAAEPERALALRASALWPGFAAELEAASGRSVFLNQGGALLLAGDAAKLEVMRARAEGELRIVDAGEARALVPLLGESPDLNRGGLWSPHEAHVDNRALTEALAVAFLKAGGTLLPNEGAVAIEQGTVLTPYGRYQGDAILVAAGAWSGLLDQIPIVPVKGEVIALTPPPGAALPVPVVWGEHVYCVPRPHVGLLLVGATVEEAGFDTSPTQAGCDHLRACAEKLIPSLKDWALSDHWAGLRPKSPDGLPLLGQTATAGLFVAGGQYRNGILFTPAIAAEMADLILGKTQVIPAFDPRRFLGRFA